MTTTTPAATTAAAAPTARELPMTLIWTRLASGNYGAIGDDSWFYLAGKLDGGWFLETWRDGAVAQATASYGFPRLADARAQGHADTTSPAGPRLRLATDPGGYTLTELTVITGTADASPATTTKPEVTP